MEKKPVASTRRQLEEFKDSFIWHDIINELEDWKFITERAIIEIPENAAGENLSTAATLMQIGGLSGVIKSVDYMIDILDTIINELEIQKEVENANEEEG